MNLKLRKTIHYLYSVLAGMTKNELKMWTNLKLSNLKSELCCFGSMAWRI